MIEELDKNGVDAEAMDMLKLRLQMAKSSVKKYQAAERCVCSDGRARGLFQFYGASRTGRYSGRNIQLQNLPQNHLAGLGLVRELVRERDLETLELCFDSVPDVLSQLIRTAFVAGEGNIFHVADYSAIEARVIGLDKPAMSITGSGGISLADELGLPFIQEVLASNLAIRKNSRCRRDYRAGRRGRQADLSDRRP